MPQQFMYTRGARRSAAPSYLPAVPVQADANIQQQDLANLLRQVIRPTQVQQAPQRMQDSQITPQERPVTAGALQDNPALVQALLREVEVNGQADGNIGFNPNAGPLNPAVARGLDMVGTMGLTSLVGPFGPMIRSILKNPASETAAPVAGMTALLKNNVPGLSAIDMSMQAFGMDSISTIANNIMNNLRGVQAPAPVRDSVGTPVNRPDAPAMDEEFDPSAFVDNPELMQQLMDQFNNYNPYTGGYGSGDWSGGFGVNQSAGGTTDHGEGDGGFGGTRTA